MTPRRNRPSRRGFTVPELAVVAAIFVVIAGMVAKALSSIRSLTRTGSEVADLEDAGERAVRAVVEDLKRSGFVEIAGANYPYLFDDGAALDPFAIHAHPPAAKQAQPGDPDFGPNREIVFVLPADANEDGVPDLDVEGNLLWEPTEVSYVVITGADGVNVLERRIDGGSPRAIARHVERIVFDDPASSGFQVPLGTVRVRMDFRAADVERRRFRHSREVLVRLRNG
jgi:prepilin-type N-terminal cleavage/methylation domain-containing protein